MGMDCVDALSGGEFSRLYNVTGTFQYFTFFPSLTIKPPRTAIFERTCAPHDSLIHGYTHSSTTFQLHHHSFLPLPPSSSHVPRYLGPIPFHLPLQHFHPPSPSSPPLLPTFASPFLPLLPPPSPFLPLSTNHQIHEHNRPRTTHHHGRNHTRRTQTPIPARAPPPISQHARRQYHEHHVDGPAPHDGQADCERVEVAWAEDYARGVDGLEIAEVGAHFGGVGGIKRDLVCRRVRWVRWVIVLLKVWSDS